jgi:hypothetical protein
LAEGWVGEGWVMIGEGSVGEGWERDGLITSFNIYISHVKKFTSKIKKNYDGFKSAGIVFNLFTWENLKNGPSFTTAMDYQARGLGLGVDKI